jgi:hypothetical protein
MEIQYHYSEGSRPEISACCRVAGDAVDLLYEGGWWEGYVMETRDSDVTIFFPDRGETELVIEDQSKLPPDEVKKVR